jgi:hypothetical protein
VSYQLPGGNLSWSSTFREIESNKERLSIVDYSVSQTTLDQVRKERLDIKNTITSHTYVVKHYDCAKPSAHCMLLICKLTKQLLRSKLPSLKPDTNWSNHRMCRV